MVCIHCRTVVITSLSLTTLRCLTTAVVYFMYGLFKDAVSNSGSVPSANRVTVNSGVICVITAFVGSG